jgi:hypothetical protein
MLVQARFEIGHPRQQLGQLMVLLDDQVPHGQRGRRPIVNRNAWRWQFIFHAA